MRNATYVIAGPGELNGNDCVVIASIFENGVGPQSIYLPPDFARRLADDLLKAANYIDPIEEDENESCN